MPRSATPSRRWQPRTLLACRILAPLLAFAVLGIGYGAEGEANLPPVPSGGRILHHQLAVELDPLTHRLRAHDRLTVTIPSSTIPSPTLASPTQTLEFTLAPTLQVTRLRAVQKSRTIPLKFQTADRVAPDLTGDTAQVVTVTLMEPPSAGPLEIEWEYSGLVQDAPREPRHLRFVTPSETSGYIGPEGVYLSSESQWYPDQVGSLPTFHVQVTLPRGWSAVTHGREVAGEPATGAQQGSVSVWEVPDPTEALTLVANQFVRATRTWRDPVTGQSVLLETDFLPANAQLAGEYLDATARYLEVYNRLLGPYPFSKFAVVENFFPSGLGMPSFTLLGSGVVKRHYVQPYALGHEIVHSWIGNAVFNRPGTGNWVEGLTTYLANYYYDEFLGRTEEAREQRRLMLMAYAVYVSPDADYPIGQFTRKMDQKDNAVGYQKTAMVFHMLRRQIGEQAFWRAIRRLGEDYRHQQVDWPMLEALFSQESGRPLGGFFDQWIARAGAPALTMAMSVETSSANQSEASHDRRVQVAISQAAPPFEIDVPLVLLGAQGARSATSVHVATAEQSFRIPVAFAPEAVLIDPDFHVFRRLDRAHLPGMLNLVVTDSQRTIVASKGRDSEEASVYRRIGERLTGPGAGEAEETSIVSVESLGQGDRLGSGSLLFLGPETTDAWRAQADPDCAGQLQTGEGRLTIQGQPFEGQGLALLLSCHRKNHPGHMATLFYGLSPKAAGQVARLLFFYGWQSYLVFRDGAVVARGDLGPELGRVQVRRE